MGSANQSALCAIEDWSLYFRSDPVQDVDDRYSDVTYLYRYFRPEGRLLYTGVSCQPWERHSQHRSAIWHPHVRVMRIERFPTRSIALVAETISIQDERPDYNSKVRMRQRTWYPPDFWYRDRMKGAFVGEHVAWFNVEADGWIGHRILQPDWWRDGFTQTPLETEDNLYFKALMASIPK